eukprot:8301452-Pyramimonas_sp.AAC.1
MQDGRKGSARQAHGVRGEDPSVNHCARSKLAEPHPPAASSATQPRGKIPMKQERESQLNAEAKGEEGGELTKTLSTLTRTPGALFRSLLQ